MKSIMDHLRTGTLIGAGITGAGISIWLAFWMVVAAAIVVTLALVNFSALATVQWPITLAFVLLVVGVTLALLSRNKEGIRYTSGLAAVILITAIGTGSLMFVMYPGGGAEVRASAVETRAAQDQGGQVTPPGDILASLKAMQDVSNMMLSEWGPWLFLFMGVMVAIQGGSTFVTAHKGRCNPAE